MFRKMKIIAVATIVDIILGDGGSGGAGGTTVSIIFIIFALHYNHRFEHGPVLPEESVYNTAIYSRAKYRQRTQLETTFQEKMHVLEINEMRNTFRWLPLGG